MNDKRSDETPLEIAREGAAADDDAAQAASVNDRPAAADNALQELSREELENALEMARAEIERLQDQSLRRQAELINYRRRVQREIAEAAALGQSRLMEQLMPVLDDFERAVGAETDDVESYRQGMQLIVRSLQKVLEQIGIERIDPVGKPFDPEFHEAIARHETDEAPDGQVIDVYQTGYRLGERLIRPAAVVVAYAGGGKAAAEDADATAGDDDA